MTPELQAGLALAAVILALGVGFALIIAASAFIDRPGKEPPRRPPLQIPPREAPPTWTWKKKTTTRKEPKA